MSVKDKAVAIDRFVRTIKESGVYDDIGTACIMAGWANLAGALTPLKGAAPTNGGGLFQDADLDPGIGLKGNGSTKYLDSNRANNADSATDCHLAVFAAAAASGPLKMYIGGQISNPYDIYRNNDDINFRSGLVDGSKVAVGGGNNIGLIAHSRAAANAFSIRTGGVTTSGPAGSRTPEAVDVFVYARNNNGTADYRSDATLSWYSIGSATDLAALDSAVSTLMADLRAIDEAGFDRDALAYIRNVEAADGSYLETGVKQAVNAFVVGCKKDGIWDALKASCIMCGARTISGALVPLVGTAPTPYNFVAADYDRSGGGLKGDGATKYLDSNRANNADGQSDQHLAMYVAEKETGTAVACIGAGPTTVETGATNIGVPGVSTQTTFRSRNSATDNKVAECLGFVGVTRSDAASFTATANGSTFAVSRASQTPTSDSIAVFSSTGGAYPTDARLAFYSIGSALDLAALDNRVTTLVSAIAAAI